MTLHLTQTEAKSEHKSFRLSKPTPPSTREVRDDVVLSAERARAVLTAAAAKDVAHGGHLSPGPAGLQVWSGPWTGPTGGPGVAEHLGSVDWSWDTPTTGYITVYRVLLTAAGVQRGLTTDGLLASVLALAGVEMVTPPSSAGASVPLPRDPFRSEGWQAPLLTRHTTRS